MSRDCSFEECSEGQMQYVFPAVDNTWYEDGQPAAMATSHGHGQQPTRVWNFTGMRTGARDAVDLVKKRFLAENES